MCPDMMSTGFSGAERGGVRIGDSVAVDEIRRLTGGRGVDVAYEALGTQATFEAGLRVLRPGGTLSSLGVYSQDMRIPVAAFAAGLGDHAIVTNLCPWLQGTDAALDGDHCKRSR